jgi:hypothetical protein
MMDKFLHIDFINGNGNFKKYFDEMDVPFVALYDCNPQNKRLFSDFSVLFSVYNNPDKMQFIVPSVCMEFYIICSLVALGYDFKFKYKWMKTVLDYVTKKKLIKNMPPKSIGYSGSNKNFETQCKMVLDNASEYYRNVDSSKIANKTRLENITKWRMTTP